MTKSISLTELEKALASLEKALQKPIDEFIRDACIQRFEYSFELAWKVGKRVLEKQGIQSSSPRSVIRDMAQQNWIADPASWIKFLEDRNLTTHTYKEDIANTVYQSAKNFAPACRALLEQLKKI